MHLRFSRIFQKMMLDRDAVILSSDLTIQEENHAPEVQSCLYWQNRLDILGGHGKRQDNM